LDKQQQLGGICVELEAANSKGNSRQLFQIVKSMALEVPATSAMYPVSDWRKFE